eukprot:4318168-Prymnesium_polylepis.2
MTAVSAAPAAIRMVLAAPLRFAALLVRKELSAVRRWSFKDVSMASAKTVRTQARMPRHAL